MRNLFSAYSVNDLSLQNRFVAQAMEINSAGESGMVSERILNRYKRLALGKWGMVFVEAISVTPESLARNNGLVITRKTLDSFKRLVGEFKSRDEKALIMLQLTHAGRVAGGFSKKVCIFGGGPDIPELTKDELGQVRDAFIVACGLAHEAGADGVDIKACHGYLLGEMLRPANMRGDIFGGSYENRSRLICDIIKDTKKLHPGFVIGSRISFYEGIRGGCGTASPDEVIENLDGMMETAGYIVKAGADYINVSAGIPSVTPKLTRPGEDGKFNMYSHFRYAKTVKEKFPGIAVIGSAYSAGSKLSAEFADENIGKGYTDIAGFGRQSLADPLFPARLREAPDSIRWCKLCGGCSKLLKAMKNVACPLDRGEA